MKKFLSLFFIFSACALNAAQIERGPYVEDAQQTTAVVRFATDVPSAAWLEYGPEGKCSQLMAISSKKRLHAITLHGLIPNTKFCYKVYVENNEGSGVQEPKQGAFKTLFTPDRKIVNFMVIGNTSDPAGNTAPIKARMAQSMAAYESDFLIHTGDMSSQGTNDSEDKEFFRPYKNILSSTPFLSALGEDEYGPDKATPAGKGFLAGNFKKIHSMPWSKGTPNYYYIDTANARIVVIDTNNQYGALGAPLLNQKSAQYDWLRSSLATAGADKWKIVVMHHPVYSSGKEEDRLSQFLAPLFEVQKVNLVIQGHQGAYERTKPIWKDSTAKAGPTYITIGGSGKVFEPSAYSNEWSSKYYATPHFAHISIVDRKLSLRVYTHENKRLDALDIYF